MTDFAFSDLGRVHWGSTLKLAAGRGFATGAIVALLLLFTGGATMGRGAPSGAALLGLALVMPFAWAALGPLFALFYWVLGWLVGKFVPGIGGLILITSALIICLGDPIVYFLNRAYPALFNIADLRFFNFRPMIFVTHPG